MTFEHDDHTAAKGQLDGRLLTGVPVKLVFDQPGELAGVRRKDSRPAGAGQDLGPPPRAFSASASKTIGLAIVLIEPDYQQIEIGRMAGARPAGDDRGRLGEFHDAVPRRQRDPPSPSAGSGAVM